MCIQKYNIYIREFFEKTEQKKHWKLVHHISYRVQMLNFLVSTNKNKLTPKTRVSTALTSSRHQEIITQSLFSNSINFCYIFIFFPSLYNGFLFLRRCYFFFSVILFIVKSICFYDLLLNYMRCAQILLYHFGVGYQKSTNGCGSFHIEFTSAVIVFVIVLPPWRV